MSKNNNNNGNKILWAFIWIAVGILWLLSNYGKLPFSFTLQKDWPVIFIIIGVISLYKIITNYSCCSKKISIVTDKKDIEDKRKQILDDVENNEISAAEAAEKLKNI